MTMRALIWDDDGWAPAEAGPISRRLADAAAAAPDKVLEAAGSTSRCRTSKQAVSVEGAPRSGGTLGRIVPCCAARFRYKGVQPLLARSSVPAVAARQTAGRGVDST